MATRAATRAEGPPTPRDLAATPFVDSGDPAVTSFAARVSGGAGDAVEQAARLFAAVRDEIRYDPYRMPLDPAAYRASAVLAERSDDVRHIVLTHLDVDHAGGLSDFPQARVHVWARELETMMRPPVRERARYAMGRAHWAHGPRWATHELAGDEWLGFESVRVLPDSDAEILLIPLPGHSLGHTGVAVRQPDGWLLHCGDAYFFRGEVDTPPTCPPALRAFEAMVQANGKLRHQSQERLRELARRHSGESS
jgi:glyoxylase-like metal-dependent hydrolase (beta-lactamase superfamily II)